MQTPLPRRPIASRRTLLALLPLLPVTALLSVAGFTEPRFRFEGFLPARPKARRDRLAQLARSDAVVVLYESPHRIVETAEDLAAALDPGRTVMVGRELTKRFAGLVALDGVSLALRPGRITALIGPNGSGKSTLVNVVSGIDTPSAGQVTLRGRDIGGRSNPEVAAAGLVRTFQDPRLVPSFTVRENVMLGAHLKHRGSMLAAALRTPAMMREERETIARAGEIMAIAGLTAVADQLLESLPYGYRRLAEVARALMADPEVLMLDEPAAGLSEGELGRLAEVIRWVRSRGKAVLLIEHHMDFVADLVDDVVVLDSGRVIYRGDMQGMRRDTAVIEAYLGVQTPRTADA